MPNGAPTSFVPDSPSTFQADEPLPDFKLNIPPEGAIDPATGQKVYGGPWSGGAFSPYQEENMREAVQGLTAPLNLASKVVGGITGDVGEMAADFLRRTGIDPSAEAGKPIIPIKSIPLELTGLGSAASVLKTAFPKVTGALEQNLGETAAGFTEPGQAALLPFAATKPVQAAFAVQSAAAIPEQIQAVGRAQTPEDLTKALAGLGENAAMAYLLGRHLNETPKGAPNATESRIEPASYQPEYRGNDQVRTPAPPSGSGSPEQRTPPPIPQETNVPAQEQAAAVEAPPKIEDLIKTKPAPAEAPAPEVPAPSPELLPHDPESESATVGAGNETAAELNRHGTPSGLPPGVPDRGPGFAAELLEASRQLGTTVRSRVTLAPGVLGMYSRARSAVNAADKIEVGDIRNQLTVAHEMGHDLDALIWPRVMLDRSQKSLVDRVGGGNAKDLVKELTPISELMRGPMTGSKGHIAYRKSATELIADYFALYAHDPERARAMAPKFSEGFERQLAKHPDANGVIQQLVEGNISPIPGERGNLDPAATPTATPGAVPARAVEAPMARDAQAAVEGENLVTGLVRTYEAQKQRARIVADNWRETVPDRDQRKDVGAFVEGIGNVEHPGDTIENVKDRMTPAMQKLAKDYRFAIEAQRNDINAYLKDSEQGEYLNFLEDYLPHFYANTGTRAGQAAISRFLKDSPNAKARKLPTLQEAADLGLIPITQDPAVLFEHHANINWRVAVNRQLMHAIKDITTASGEPAVVPAKDAPPGYVITQNPLVQKVYARQTPDGVMLWKGGAAIHPDLWRSVRQMLEQPVSSDFAKAFDAVNAVTRANAFAFSLFHDLTLRSAATGEMAGVNPLRGLVRIMERDPNTGELKVFQSTRGLGKELLKNEAAVTDAAEHGLHFSWTESESYQRNARDFLEKAAAQWRDVPILGKAAGLARDIQAMRQEGLWRNTHDAFKIVAYNDAVAKALANAPKGADVKAIKEQIASRLNDAFGGQEWQTKFWLSPTMRKNLGRFFLSPDWTFSTLRSVPGVSDALTTARMQAGRLTGRGPGFGKFEGTAGNLGRMRFWGAELAALTTATLATQYAIYHSFGDPNKGDHEWVWQNEEGNKGRVDITPLMRSLPGRDPNDRTRYYVNLGKRPEEVIAWISNPEKIIESKMARPVAEVFRQVTGTEGDMKATWKQDHEAFLESLGKRAKSIGSEFLPFVFSGNQFALSVPYRKGMTRFKAQDAYQSVYELAGDPGHFAGARAFLRGVPNPEGTLRGMVSEISDAARANGVNAEEVRKHALSVVRGEHYNAFFKAFQKGDQDTMNKEAAVLQRLGVGLSGAMENVQRRMEMQRSQ